MITRKTKIPLTINRIKINVVFKEKQTNQQQNILILLLNPPQTDTTIHCKIEPETILTNS